jgi:multifunctional methyltransferase subunit TRM112
MKFMTTNFVQCAVRSCSKTTDAFPLQYTDLTLIRQETEFDSDFILNILPRLDWNALVKVAAEVG